MLTTDGTVVTGVVKPELKFMRTSSCRCWVPVM
jgi:hypothetical protein